jgi:alpha-tubulin suppressor-like RCC1 family protein
MAEGEVEVSSVLRPKRKSSDSVQLYSQPSWSSGDSSGTTGTRRSLDMGAALGTTEHSNKKQKTTATLATTVKEQHQPQEFAILSGSLGILSIGELELVLSFCDARTLANLNCTSKYFTSTQITEEVAKQQVKRGASYQGIQPSKRSKESWMALLHYLTASEQARESEKRVGLGSYHTALISGSGTGEEEGEDLYTFGRGFHGQLGNGKYENQPLPERIEVISPSSSDFSCSEKKKKRDNIPSAIACGSSHNAVISSTGALYTWGLASSGELGHGGWTPIELSIPKQLSCFNKVKMTSVSCGSNHTVATSACGGIWTCGRGRNGQLGHGHLHDEGPMKRVESLANFSVVAVAAGGTHTMALCAGGRVFSWGNNLHGQLGHQLERYQDEHSLFRSVALPKEVVVLRPKSKEDPERIVSLSAGTRHSLGITASGSLFAWGDGSHGCLGLGDNLRRSIPTRVRFLKCSETKPGKMRCVHACAGGHHTAILVHNSGDFTNTLLTTGCNHYGQLGHRDRKSRSTFTPVEYFQRHQSIRLQSVSIGDSSTAAVTCDNKVFLWGRGELGQLGTNDYRSHWFPKLVKC